MTLKGNPSAFKDGRINTKKKGMKIMIKNCTPHVIRLNDGQEFQPCGIIPRVAESFSEWTVIEGVPVCSIEPGEVLGLPLEETDTWLVVSSKVFDARPDRKDLLTPLTNHPAAVRKDGQPYSVPGFRKRG